MKNTNKLPAEITVLAEKMLKQTITPEEKERLERWYQEYPTEMPVWELKDESRGQLSDRLFTSIRGKIDFAAVNASKSWKSYLAMAASLIIISSIGLFYWLNKSGETPIIENIQASSNGTIKKVYLPDHTIVWLKGNSTLDYPSHFSDSTRNVTLHGEALFEVNKDKAHPFIIKTGNYLARVLGTSFNIKESTQTHFFKLTVLTGKVAVSARSSQLKNGLNRPVIITHGNEFEINNTQLTPKIIPASVAEKPQILNGTEYDMNLDNVAFDEMKKRVEKKFNVKINIGKNNYSNCFISADVTDQSLENTLKVISSVTNSKYTIINNQIDFTGGGCN